MILIGAPRRPEPVKITGAREVLGIEAYCRPNSGARVWLASRMPHHALDVI